MDQNAPVTVAEALRSAGHEATHTRERGLARAEDQELLRIAVAEGAVVVTFDSDFARMLALSGQDAPSLIHVRLGPSGYRKRPMLCWRRSPGQRNTSPLAL